MFDSSLASEQVSPFLVHEGLVRQSVHHVRMCANLDIDLVHCRQVGGQRRDVVVNELHCSHHKAMRAL